MGASVKEALRRLCVEFGWSYAVCWKRIQCGDQSRHLVWDDGHCERAFVPPAASGFEAMDLLIKESGVLRGSQSGCQAEDRVRTLVFKSMASKVHVVGDGMVGKAALTGKHEWVLGDLLTNKGFISKDSAEVNSQLSSGIKTIAIIPVLPHGIVQLGSTRMVRENFGFVNHVKGLFQQLQSVSGAPLSIAPQKKLSQKIQLSESVGMQATDKQFGELGTHINGLSSLSNDTCKRQHLLCTDFRAPTEPSDSRTQSDSQTPAGIQVPLVKQNMSSTMIPLGTPSVVRCITNPIVHLNGQHDSGRQEAHLMFSNPDVRLLRNVLPHELNCQSPYQPAMGLANGRLIFLEEQLLPMSDMRPGEFSNNCGSILLDNIGMHQLQSHGCTSFNPLQSSGAISSFVRGKLVDSANDLGKFNSFPDDTDHFRSQFADSSSAEVPQVVNPTYPSTSHHISAGSFESSRLKCIDKGSQSGSSEERQKSNNHGSQALGAKSSQFDEHGSSYPSLLCNPSKHLVRGNRALQDSACAENGGGLVLSRSGNKGNKKAESLPTVDEKVSRSILQSSSENDLFDVLRLDQYKSGFSCGNLDNMTVKGTSDAPESSADISTCITQLEKDPVYNALNDEICFSGMFSEAGGDQLLDAVISQFNPATKYEMDDNASCETSVAKTTSSLLFTSSPSNKLMGSPKQMHAETLGLPPAPMKSEPAASVSVRSSCSVERGEGFFPQSNGGCVSKSNMWMEGQKLSCDDHSVVHDKKVDGVAKQIRKRSRPGENPRPRPKDRQMIQDRVKELREIIPNGAKCSIDALLEKTIKHMLFLQSVTKHAEKLKETGEPKILGKEGGLLLTDNFEGGATWAFEVGSHSMACPIIVEDLNPPRQMLVEMLCEERGLFLEIADLVRGLGLTILKGVMEARDDKVWARFAVEANRDVTRMEIFLSLVRLLEPSTGIDIAPEGFDNLNKTHVLHSPSSIPAAGVLDCLW